MTAPAGSDPLEGAGVISSWADLVEAVGGGDGAEIGFAATAAGLDTLGLVADPFGSLFAAGAGWLMEHVWFLREPLDQLAGDPQRIEATAQAWHAVSVELAAVADGQRAEARPDGWAGAANKAYRLAAVELADRVDEAAAVVDRMATDLIHQGAAVGTVRAIIRDEIAELIGRAVAWILGGALTAALTGGVSALAAVGWVIVDALALAARFADRIADLLRALAAAGNAFSGLAENLLRIGRAAGPAALRAHEWAKPVDERLDRVPGLDWVVEGGKQYSTADLP